MKSFLKPGALVAGLTALALAFGAGAATAETDTPKAKCEQEAKVEGLTDADDIKAFVYECLASAESESESAPVKPAAAEDAKKPAGGAE
jgi:hypothetical protein